jgi:hypothetical protein
MSHCRDCKHFDAKPEWELPAGWGFCRLAATHGSDEPDFPKSLALAHDAEGYRAELGVSPDFGCVQFEERE